MRRKKHINQNGLRLTIQMFFILLFKVTKDACGFDGNLAIYKNCRRISELEDFTKKNSWKYLESDGTIITFINCTKQCPEDCTNNHNWKCWVKQDHSYV